MTTRSESGTSPARAAAIANERELLEAARTGDDDAYSRLVDPYRPELRAHCYRMLGSVQDAQDALQEALLRAWRGLPRFEARSSLRSWLYTIATNACLRAIERRPKLVLPIDYAPRGRPPRRPRPAGNRIGLAGALPRREARARVRPARTGRPLRAARGDRARLHRRPAAPAGAAPGRADPA
jgi:DNA-directed RNA polymerase specialized sigma24 family protein